MNQSIEFKDNYPTKHKQNVCLKRYLTLMDDFYKAVCTVYRPQGEMITVITLCSQSNIVLH